MNGCHARSVTGERRRLLFDESLPLHVLRCLEPESEGEPSAHLSIWVTPFVGEAFKIVVKLLVSWRRPSHFEASHF